MSSKTSKRRAAPDKRIAPQAEHIPAQTLSEQRRHEQIAEAAYFLSQRRLAAGEHSDELSDWLEAERAMNQQLRDAPSGHVHGVSNHT